MGLLRVIKKRKSPLTFKEKEVPQKKIKVILEAARWAPSCFNNQPWKYVFVEKKSKRRNSFEEALSRGNQAWASKVPYLVAVAANPKDACDGNNIPYYAYDCGLSVMSLVLEAVNQGLSVHQMAGYDEKKVRKALGFPSKYRVVVVFALGYQENPKRIWKQLDEHIKERLSQPRIRKPVKKNFFFHSFKGK